MTTRADQAIAALRKGHDELTALVRGLTPEQLRGPSAAAEWDVSQVVSHLGSGAEINLEAVRRSLAGDPPPDFEFNKGVWARWDGMTPDERQAEFPAANQRLVEAYEALTPEQRSSHRIDVGWMPEPVDVATCAVLRLTEFGYHDWDVRVAFDPSATLDPAAAELMNDRIEGMFNWIAKPDRLDGRTGTLLVALTDRDERFALRVDADKVSLASSEAEVDAELSLPLEAWLRLAAGRLGAQYTPSSVKATGVFTLDDLRALFPGY
ncbi:maleylpyruvate isomerase family mycothiol-dependent enzyme [Dactylosporangium sp. AC04546]|uniref:maleylpyruvate isomerase family mycothiol-dependent enzyme n=1 Tax=Dactylosporangium sp. AC04546 TaxID=2862460 RepID=UPI001EE0B0B1|nr:maleylpyruvate isomerase family mycothiol-dependent enzyme [Dactylosporangium sp. AC04546]WVK79843.1 maleylpyruvate isomerase family mycothiol-dependent enzyme [Dactylosporangium sp. AC04546]